MKTVRVGKVIFGSPKYLPLIAGPCVIESEKSALRHAEKISKVARSLGVPYVFKASYDKANRTSVNSFRGLGLEKGLKILSKVKKEFKIPVLSDVHSIEEVGPASEVLDIMQIPAFLCRQTSFLVAVATTGRVVNVKKGQFLAPWDMEHVIKKIASTGNKKILVTDRGTSFGYNTLISDFRGVPVMRDFGYPVIFDVTHSVQAPGGKGGSSGGAPEFIPTLSRCAVAAGVDGIFMEVHENPKKALSDGANSLNLKNLKSLLSNLKAVHKVTQKVI